LLDCGASFGEGYGPIVVSSHPLKKTDLAGRKIALPGTRTTSYLALKLFEPNVETVTMPFDKILEAVQAKEVEAGLLIHEGQLLFQQVGLHRVVDLGQWWQEQTSLPLPLGANAIRRSLGPELGYQVARVIRDSVSYALEHRDAALNYALQFARDMDPVLADKFVGMYVNRWTLDYGDEGRRAVRELLARRGDRYAAIGLRGRVPLAGGLVLFHPFPALLAFELELVRLFRRELRLRP